MKTLKLSRNNKSSRGFTIVELVTVIAVIGILAAITIVSYRAIQERARDTMRRNDVANIAKATAIYITRTGDKLIDGTSCGTAGGGGYWHGSYGGQSLHGCVTAEMGSLPRLDPDSKAYMKANCMKDGEIVSYILTKQTGEPQDNNYMESICDANYGYWSVLGWDGSTYGMNYGVKVPYTF